MPELPEVETVRRELDPAMTRHRFDAITVRRPDLRAAFPADFAARLRGERVTALTRRAKFLVATLSSGETLLMHLGMSGSFRVEPRSGPAGREPASPARRHDHVVFRMSSGMDVTFNDPRRFGSMDLVPEGDLAMHPLSRLGPEPLSLDFDASVLALACRRKKVSLKAALLDQRVVAGLGNIYVSEALFLAGLSPRRRASTIATPAGLPRPSAFRLAAAIKRALEVAVARAARESYRGSRFRVYDREGELCVRSRCGGTVKRITQSGRSTFYCPACQR